MLTGYPICLFWVFTAQSTQWGHVEHGQLYWAGLVLYVVKQYCAHSFTRNWQLRFLNQRKRENDCRKYFMINLHERMLPTSAIRYPMQGPKLTDGQHKNSIPPHTHTPAHKKFAGVYILMSLFKAQTSTSFCNNRYTFSVWILTLF